MIRATLCLLLALPLARARGAEPAQVQDQRALFVGATGCKSSSCHGGAGEKRSQYITWIRQDIHTRAFAILTNARSERMADALHLATPQDGPAAATTSARCTICHSPLQTVPMGQRGPLVDPTESISCESCHGDAGAWLRGHTRPDWTYATRVGAGMRDLKSLYVRANTCVACHQNLDADLIAAGHPDLVFEMAAQSKAEPPHWRDPENSHARAWLVGQAVALRETSWKLAQNSTGNDQTLAQWQGLAWLLARVTAADASLQRIEPPPPPGTMAAYASTQQQADALARRASKQALDSAFVRRLRSTLASTNEEFVERADTPRAVLFPRAQRLVLALAALAPDQGASTPQMDDLRKDVRNITEFHPAQFSAHLAQLRDTLSAQ